MATWALRAATGLALGATLLAGPAGARQPPPALADMVASVLPTVVNITARAEIAPATAAAQVSTPTDDIRVSAGSGFVIDPSGLIATNWHVVSGAYEIIVTFSDGTHATAKVAEAARVVDLALIRVKVGHPLPAVRWGDSSKVRLGDPVVAIGNALGVGMSVSAGIVSALNRNISDTPVDDFIQTDAAINHGNSGGPLFNADAEVIGINSAIISPTAANAGLGFALPSNDAQFIFQRLTHTGTLERPGWLGAKLQAITVEMAEALGQTEPRSSVVAWVMADGPADRAGLRAGDVILRLNGQPPTDDRALLRDITKMTPGTKVTLGVWRGGQELELTATLTGWPESVWERNAAPPPPKLHRKIPSDLGLTLAPLPLAEQYRADLEMKADGVLVTGVMEGTEPDRRGVAPGDVVLQVGPTPVHTPDELRQAIAHARAEGRQNGLFLILPKPGPMPETKFPGPHWIALAVGAE